MADTPAENHQDGRAGGLGGLFTRSLARRLVLASLLAAVLLLMVAGLLLLWMFGTTLERQFDSRLESLMNGLLANIEQRQNAGIYVSRPLANPLFQLPASGWYWQITPLDDDRQPALASPSLLEKRFDVHRFDRAPRLRDGTLRRTLVGPHGHLVRVMEQRLSLFGDSNRYSVLIAGDAGALRKELHAFGRVVAIMFLLFGLVLAVTIFLQVRYGLRPLKLLHDEIADVRDGRRQRLEGEFPREIEPVVTELNKLIRANREVVERARTQVGNLAHALKTPLAVLINEAATRDDDLSRLVLEQTGHMRQQVELYLDRARRAALAGTLGVATPVEKTLAPIINALRRIYQERGVRVEMHCDEALFFRGERQDLEEMLGNLLDNAFKYGGGRVRVNCRGSGAQLEICVEDDGRGLTPEQRRQALRRGRRLDEAAPGSGLGLSIVKELAEMYHGELRLDASPLGGLRAALRLPAVRKQSGRE